MPILSVQIASVGNISQEFDNSLAQRLLGQKGERGRREGAESEGGEKGLGTEAA